MSVRAATRSSTCSTRKPSGTEHRAAQPGVGVEQQVQRRGGAHPRAQRVGPGLQAAGVGVGDGGGVEGGGAADHAGGSQRLRDGARRSGPARSGRRPRRCPARGSPAAGSVRSRSSRTVPADDGARRAARRARAGRPRGAARGAAGVAAALRGAGPAGRSPDRPYKRAVCGGRQRRASRTPCSRATAAAWSMTARCFFALLPEARRAAVAVTVVSRSSTSSTGTGADQRGERLDPGARHVGRRRRRGPAQRRRQPDDDEHRLALGDELGDPAVAGGGHGLDRRGEDPVRVARGDADPDRADVDRDDDALHAVRRRRRTPRGRWPGAAPRGCRRRRCRRPARRRPCRRPCRTRRRPPRG